MIDVLYTNEIQFTHRSSPYCEVLSALKVRSALVETSTLNPLAEEFVPTLTLVPTAT